MDSALEGVYQQVAVEHSCVYWEFEAGSLRLVSLSLWFCLMLMWINLSLRKLSGTWLCFYYVISHTCVWKCLWITNLHKNDTTPFIKRPRAKYLQCWKSFNCIFYVFYMSMCLSFISRCQTSCISACEKLDFRKSPHWEQVSQDKSGSIRVCLHNTSNISLFLFHVSVHKLCPCPFLYVITFVTT